MSNIYFYNITNGLIVQFLFDDALPQVSFLFSGRGTPDGYRHMNGYGSHTFKLVNAKDEAVYCKFHFKTNQGIKNLTADDAGALTGCDPDYALRDLYNAIESGNHPSWTAYLQVSKGHRL